MDAFYRWDEIIFISKDERGQPVILEEIPPPYYTEARAALYDPYARIEPGFVSARVREILPPIQSPTEMVVPP